MNEKTMPMSPNKEWLQFYKQPMSTVDEQASTDDGAPASSTKPLRRRSRASKKTPTTLLNANANNFRALVQQFTGCPSADLFSLANQKGPVDLNFGLKNATPILESPPNVQYFQPLQLPEKHSGQHDHQHYSSSTFINTTPDYAFNYNNSTTHISDLSINDYAQSMESFIDVDFGFHK